MVDSPGVDVELVQLACSGDMYSGVPTTAPNPVTSVLSVSGCPARLGHAEVDHLRHRPAVVQGDQDVGRLEVAVDDALLVGVLDRLADRDEQLQPLPRGEPVLVAVLGDRHALDQLHDEVRPARPSVVPASSTLAMLGWSISASGLPLGLEPGQHLPASPSRP